jgi:hypothetical protein
MDRNDTTACQRAYVVSAFNQSSFYPDAKANRRAFLDASIRWVVTRRERRTFDSDSSRSTSISREVFGDDEETSEEGHRLRRPVRHRRPLRRRDEGDVGVRAAPFDAIALELGTLWI